MSRWISSALCTAALVAVLFCLPFWGIRSSSSSPASIVSDTTVSNVRIVKRAPKQTPAVVQPVQNESIPAVPTKPAETIPLPKPEEKPEQAEETSAEAPEKPFEQAAEAVDETSYVAAGESTASDAANAGDVTDSFSHTHDAKAAATYKSYVLGRIASKKTYPYAARSNGLEGKVRARAVINPDGTLADAVILTPCEYELLNTACLAAIKKAAPFKKMSAGMGVLTVSFVMDFSLH
ncbi:TonB family domain-containing protein [Treponema maltophilum ATCC 51939]|uniref:TonB family domain-containing protein n=1 Tax=Treponema maltophilum ATCC 51939 TaxID=1125699 RepID=S3K3I8_TREMA|nr:energy transducer TonB [Treponema maltophilum]EPF32075.1 TonB family domain-containing protein [Treponema maltophilum ATCC 51939]